MRLIIRPVIFSCLLIFMLGCKENHLFSKKDKSYFILKKSELSQEPYHTQHHRIFSKYAEGWNPYVLKGIDIVQATAMDGGGYFVGITANPPESPIGYDLKLLGRELIKAPRTTSYCSGSSYAAFIEAMNLILADLNLTTLDSVHLEAMRMQEPDGGRREDHVKFWGKWNADGFGNHFSLVQYSGMGKVVLPSEARPGDFANISWKSGLGHSVIFLAWVIDDQGKYYLRYWSSQKSTHGLSDQLVPVENIKNIKIVRLTKPENIKSFDVENNQIEIKISGDEIMF
ncbi:MAG: hypothetical protein JXQ65_04365 [Candidatus Marinimicrobia bacterium]|nr:hypothetical protein [Candidatus Neomarinimicrobiota bacterium]